MTERFALYFAPARDSALGERAEAWLAQPDIAGLTVSARKYGFHATLKAPMALAEGVTQGKLRAAIEAFAAAHRPVDMGRMESRSLGGFLALMPVVQTEELRDFAGRVMTEFDHFRAPLTDADRARRNVASLTARQTELLERYGYQYVLEEFIFHMTLTDMLAMDVRDGMMARARSWFGKALAEPVVLDRLVLFHEPEAGAAFVRLDDFVVEGGR